METGKYWWKLVKSWWNLIENGIRSGNWQVLVESGSKYDEKRRLVAIKWCLIKKVLIKQVVN